MQSWKVVVTFESVDEVLWCNNTNETSSAELSHGSIIKYVVLTVESVDEILWRNNSKETSAEEVL